MIQTILLNLILALVKIIAAVVLSANAAYLGMTLLDRITAQIEEWKEIKKGNIAVGILYAAAIFSLVMLVEPRIVEFVNAIQVGQNAPMLLATLVMVFANYFVAVLLGIIIIFLSIHAVDRLSPDLEEIKELKKGNVAVAVIIAVVLIAIAFALRGPFESVFDTIKSIENLII